MVSSDGNKTSFNYFLIRSISRGNLLYPNADNVDIGLIGYIANQKFACFDEFFKSNSQRTLSVNSIFTSLDDKVLLLDFSAKELRYSCSSNHESIQLVENDIIKGATKVVEKKKIGNSSIPYVYCIIRCNHLVFIKMFFLSFDFM